MIVKNISEEWKLSDLVVILGNFDGIHLGHNLLIEKAKQMGQEQSRKVGVLTFDPHPSKVFIGDSFRLIYTEEEKIALFEEKGLDYYILFPFTEENRSMSPEDFIQKTLFDRLGVKAVVVGSDYRFGKKAAGDAKLLKTVLSAKGIQVEILDKLQDHGQDISSTRLRTAIKSGDFHTFEELCGRRFHIKGRVRDGQKLGRTLGFPTANLLPEKDKLLPPNGVYFTEVYWQNRQYLGLSNVGISPTLENRPYSVETYILDFDESIYGEEIEVRFVHRIRSEQKFDTIEELKSQIEKDVAQVIKESTALGKEHFVECLKGNKE